MIDLMRLGPAELEEQVQIDPWAMCTDQEQNINNGILVEISSLTTALNGMRARNSLAALAATDQWLNRMRKEGSGQ